MAEYIRLYRIIDFNFSDGYVIPFKAYPPRPEHCLQFMPKDPETIQYPDSGVFISPKKVLFMGPHTTIIHRYPGKKTLGVQVIFQPGAICQITQISSDELTNKYMDAEELFGNCTRLVNEQLFHSSNYPEMICIVERFLSALIKRRKQHKHPVDEIGKMMTFEHENFSLDKFLKAACLSHRQLDRKFKERIGLVPKQFLQMSRFDKAFRMKNRFPQKDWLSIALHCGYYDYQHLVKDYKEFTGYTPTQFFVIDNQAPERAFGDAEV
ncbi:helix-turn-helix domain-containing protein [Flavihumibacter fluvii]|uniref:helix-turn-helix domain-containing protein n=1 Tax=Flavihumibacter fluvii TaxID=2838157 RepID=UPI001BDDF3DF|nr:helix-turn-helix domain-containing protein [Flavihumibacter fluvii]ULQ51529.1 helix-turn-helix domain-containing protein [Flavihumibacter fluvii]